jgi:16S rRNA (adenine1518-N6/adenine1519-N6)-dimethyltransferase
MILPRLTDIDTLERILAKEKAAPLRQLGQNFLICDEPIEATIAALRPHVTNITELGAGVGPLTQALLSHNYSVRAIEQDTRLASALIKNLPTKLQTKLELITGDLREHNWEHQTPWQLVGNIPYNLSGLILRRLTQLQKPPEQAILMVQREVADNLTAQVPHLGLLSLNIQLWGEAHLLLNIPASCYFPEPKVSSALVILIPHQKSPSSAAREQILAVAKHFFRHRRKQIGGVMRNQLKLTDQTINSILAHVGATPIQRPQELTIDQWISLASVIRDS